MKELPSWIVCPACKGRLKPESDHVRCVACSMHYQCDDGMWHLLADPGDRFFDDEGCGYGPENAVENEEYSNKYTAQHYYLPLWSRLFGDAFHNAAGKPARILSAGCGVGADVDVDRDNGIDAYGIDCGGRTQHWSRRRYPESLYFANVKSLPFADASFDAVKTDCLLPHVGVVGDSTVVTDDCEEQRRQVAAELTRVVRPGGYLIMANPNQLCPVDLFHKGQMKNPNGLVRFHSLTEKFLLSFADYRRYFLDEQGCHSVSTLPVSGYWPFFGKSRDPVKRFLVPPVQAYFAFLSMSFMHFLRVSPLNPWLMVIVRK